MPFPVSLEPFPASELDEVSLSDADLLQEHDDLVDRGRVIASATARHTEYSKFDFRKQYCRTAIALNNRQLLAPAARPKISISYKPAALSDAEKLISNDRQVIDLHWLWCLGYQPERCNGPTYRCIFDPAEFNVERAWAFVSQVGAVKLKVEKLDLAINEQLLLASLRGSEARSEDKAIDVGVQKFRKAISGLNGPTGIDAKRWAMVRKADLIARQDGSEPTAAVVIKVYRWLTADGVTSDAALRKTVTKVQKFAAKLGSAE
jgi:hypothetical protein